jgi:hypothetical protein
MLVGWSVPGQHLIQMEAKFVWDSTDTCRPLCDKGVTIHPAVTHLGSPWNSCPPLYIESRGFLWHLLKSWGAWVQASLPPLPNQFLFLPARSSCIRCSTGSLCTLRLPTRSVPFTHTIPRCWASIPAGWWCLPTWTHASRPLGPLWTSIPQPSILQVSTGDRISVLTKGPTSRVRPTCPGTESSCL